MNLERKWVKFTDQAVTDEGTIEGYGAIFGNVDQGGDVIHPGAFQASLKANEGQPLKMLWQHWDPIGAWTSASEDDRGLKVKGTALIGSVQQAREAHALAKAGVVDGLSIGYMPKLAERDRSGVRHIKEADLYEVSLVTFPMNPQARIARVKSGSIDIRALEEALRDAGLSRREAKALLAEGAAGLGLRDADDLGAALARGFRELNERIGT